MPHILPVLTNETIKQETGDYNPVFYNACAWSAQSVKTLQNTLRHTDHKR